MFNFTTLPPLSLYVHIPWCVRKCPYCDFNSHEARDGIDEPGYVAALLADLEQELPDVWGRSVQSVFIGGGTPSLFSPKALDHLISGLRARLPLLPDAEITLEANPGTVEQGRFKEFRAVGINRLSIGIQSFDDELLKAIGRIHGREEAVRAAEAARSAGFDELNLDLMFGLPGQTLAQAEADVAQAISLEPTHLSYYQLTLEPNTAFHRAPPVLPDDDLRWEMQIRGQAAMAEAGFGQYEVSAYAREGHQCRHNLNYWRFGDYLGIGAGAHGKISNAAQGQILRRWKARHPKAYVAEAATPKRIAGEQQLPREDAALEFMMNALRLTEGFPSRLFSEQTGLSISIIEKSLKEAEKAGFLTWDVTTVRPTERGRQFLNELLAIFVP